MKKILIADDSPVLQNVTKKILQAKNYHIVSVNNGSQVLEKLEKEHFDLILMDILMPSMDGLACTKKVRSLKDKKKSQIPIVAISGNLQKFSEEEFTEAGINEYLQKPFNFDDLVNIVKKYTE